MVLEGCLGELTLIWALAMFKERGITFGNEILPRLTDIHNFERLVSLIIKF